MTFLVSVGLSDLRTAGGKEYAVWIADTVHLKPDGTTQGASLTRSIFIILRILYNTRISVITCMHEAPTARQRP